MSWILLIIAGLFEVGFTTCLSKARETSGSQSVIWLACFLLSMSCSMYFLYKSTQTLPMGTAYAVWTGIGALGTLLIGIIFFGEPLNFWRLFFLSTMVVSIIGLKTVAH